MRIPTENPSKNAFIEILLESENVAIALILLIVVIVAAKTFLF